MWTRSLAIHTESILARVFSSAISQYMCGRVQSGFASFFSTMVVESFHWLGYTLSKKVALYNGPKWGTSRSVHCTKMTLAMVLAPAALYGPSHEIACQIWALVMGLYLNFGSA